MSLSIASTTVRYKGESVLRRFVCLLPRLGCVVTYQTSFTGMNSQFCSTIESDDETRVRRKRKNAQFMKKHRKTRRLEREKLEQAMEELDRYGDTDEEVSVDFCSDENYDDSHDFENGTTVEDSDFTPQDFPSADSVIATEDVPNVSDIVLSDDFADLLENDYQYQTEATAPDAPNTLWHHLRNTAYQTKMNTVQVDGILQTLNKFKHDPSMTALPKTYKTFYKGEVKSVSGDVRDVSNHKYIYLGLRKQILYYLPLFPKAIDAVSQLELVWNTDGFQLFNRKRINSWPVTVYIANIRPRKVFPVVLTAGKGKPTDLDFLREFTSDLVDLVRNGLAYHNRVLHVKVKACVVDAPARSFVKCTVGHTSKHGCDFCHLLGVHDGSRIIWNKTEFVERSDSSFRQKVDPLHHKGDTPLTSLNCDLVLSYPPDFMHQVGGTFKKLLIWLLEGPGRRNPRCRMAASKVQLLNQRLEFIRPFISRQIFARRPRSTKELHDYKFTELRQMLLYTGKVLFIDLMPSDAQYQHLVDFNCYAALLVDTRTAKSCFESQSYMAKKVVKGFIRIYGEAFMSYSPHTILHFPKVASQFGGVESVSAYPFENALGSYKQHMTSSHEPIISLYTGVERQQTLDAKNGLHEPDRSICCKEHSNIYIDVEKHIVLTAQSYNEDDAFLCAEYTHTSDFLEQPFSSRRYGCYLVDLNKLRYRIVARSLLMSLRRGLQIPLGDMPGLQDNPTMSHKAVFMALFHDDSMSLY